MEYLLCPKVGVMVLRARIFEEGRLWMEEKA